MRFGKYFTDYMFQIDCGVEKGRYNFSKVSFEDIEISPAFLYFTINRNLLKK